MKNLFLFSLLLVVCTFKSNAQDVISASSKERTLAKEITLETSYTQMSKFSKELYSYNNKNNRGGLKAVDLLKKEMNSTKRNSTLRQLDLQNSRYISEIKFDESVRQIHSNMKEQFGTEASVLQLEPKVFIWK
ncbi:hypothetical protein [Flammeovirga pacifica]|uniref:Uncharacterized protein n=1 Tax=Flammeovirga pacifica TaxID=915059 RepID=A0A1S1Z0R6_FLAPC|nr:hypothetical protein [Flammeovirga pacifica]OHX66841.1 hypothetical protein NH26_10975 [Flammeovirga pacifica]